MESTFNQDEINSIKEEVRKRLSEKKFNHSCSVARIASLLASREGIDPTRAEVAGLLHDVAREYSKEQNQKVMDDYHVVLDSFDFRFPPCIHGKIGAAVAEKEFGIDDEEMLDAIRNHVTGRPNISLFEQIIFVADHIDHGLALEKYASWYTDDKFLNKSLDELVYNMLSGIIEYDLSHNSPIDERTQQYYDWMLEKIITK